MIDLPSGAVSRVHPAVFAVTVLLSAFLSFSVQPMFAKMILPKLGGSPAVWSVSMVFFQSLLLAGYAYAHRLSRLEPRHAVLIHLLVLGAAFLQLPPTLAGGFDAVPADGQAFWLLALFASSVGLPVFALSAHAPLLQSWFTRRGGAGDPYALYVASNIGSFGALLAYPLLLERFVTLGRQATFWAWGFAGLTLLVAICGRAAASGMREAPTEALSARPSWRVRARWVLLSFLPSGLLVAVTARLTTDVAAFPLLWVIPLGLYLLTFVFAFRPGAATWMRYLLLPVPAAFAVLAAGGAPNRDFALPALIHLGTSFALMLLAHRALYETRPAPDRSTEFYLAMSLGGVAGGIFTALIAPLVFSTVFEYPLLLAATAVFALPDSLLAERRTMPLFRLSAALLCGAVFFAAMSDAGGRLAALNLYGGYALAIAAFLGAMDRRLFAVLCAALALLPMSRHDSAIVLVERSFFGVHYVKEFDRFRLLQHGTTNHGAEMIKDAEGRPVEGRPVPTTYYAEGGSIADALAAARAGTAGGFSVASVGLGTGSMACHARPGDVWTFFEIDPVVIRLATDPKLFRFLGECTPGARIVAGDARTTLAAEQGPYDVIILDAFSSSSIPAHLLTREAVAVYRRLLKPEGTLVFHISNRHLDLAPPLARVAAVEGMSAWSRTDAKKSDPETFRFPSATLVMQMPAVAKTQALRAAGFEARTPDGKPPWTDDFADILGSWK